MSKEATDHGAKHDASTEQPVHVHLRFASGDEPPAQAPLWTTRPMALRHAATGALEVIGTAKDLHAATRYALSFGAAVEVLGPPVLRRRVAREARRLAALYATDCFLRETKEGARGR